MSFVEEVGRNERRQALTVFGLTAIAATETGTGGIDLGSAVLLRTSKCPFASHPA